MTKVNGLDLNSVKHEDILTGDDLTILLEAADAGDFGPLDEHDQQVVADIRAILDDFDSPDGITLIADSYFLEYAQEMAEDIGAVPTEHTWPTSYIDWEAAARDLKSDYTGYTIGGALFWATE